MAELPAAGYMTDPARTQGEYKVAIEAQRQAIAQLLGAQPEATQTVDAAGSITPVLGVAALAVGASDTLQTIQTTNLPEGSLLLLKGTSAIVKVTAGTGVGKIALSAGALVPVGVAAVAWLLLQRVGTSWVELQRAVARPAVLAPSGSVTLDAAASDYFTLTPTSAFTLENPINPSHGRRVIVRILQDATGGRLLTLGTKWRLGTDIPSVVLSTLPNKADYLGAIYDVTADRWDVVALSKGY
jgi:hypothetical protein